MTELSLQVKGNTYTIEVPTVGDMIDVERMKMALSNGFYNEMMRTQTITAQESLMAIDIQSHFTILSPKLISDLKCEDIRKLSGNDYRELKKAYVEGFLPWWNNWVKLFKEEDGK